MSQQSTLEALRPHCFATDPATGGLLSLASHPAPISAQYSLIRIKNITTVDQLQWEMASSSSKTRSFASGQLVESRSFCTADRSGAFVAINVGGIDSRLEGVRFRPATVDWAGVNMTKGSFVPRTLTTPIRTSAAMQGDIVLAQATETETTLSLVKNHGTEEEEIIKLNMGVATDLATTVRMAFDNNTLYYYRRSKGNATVTTIPMNSRAVIINSTIQDMQTYDLPNTNLCSSSEFLGVLNNKFYYLCRSGNALQLYDQERMIGSTIRNGTILAFTLYDPQAPKAILLIRPTEYDPVTIAGMNLQDASIQILNRTSFEVLQIKPTETPTTLPTDQGPNLTSSQTVGMTVGVVLFSLIFMTIGFCYCWRRRCAKNGRRPFWKRKKRDQRKSASEADRVFSRLPSLPGETGSVGRSVSVGGGGGGSGEENFAIPSAPPAPDTPWTDAHLDPAPPGYDTSLSEDGTSADTGSAPILEPRAPQGSAAVSSLSSASQVFRSTTDSAAVDFGRGNTPMQLAEITFSRHPRPNIVTSVGDR